MSKAEKERDFCTILDKLVEHKDVHENAGVLYKHCLTSLITNPVSKRSYLALDKKALSKLKNKSAAEVKKQIKMHVLGRMILPDQSFKDRTQLDVPTMLKGVKYEVSKAKSAKSIMVEGRECKLLAVTGNGALYVTDDLLPEKKAAPAAKRAKSPKRSRSRKRKQRGGSHLLSGLDARYKFLDDYRGQFQQDWSMYALAHMLLYLNQNIGDFRNMYLPFLGTDPMSTLELLLQLRDRPYDPSRLLIEEPVFSGFQSSPYYMSGDAALLQEARSLMRSFCNEMDVPGMCPYETYYIQESFIKQHQDYIKSLLTTSPIEARDKIVAIYQKLGDMDRYSPGQVALFRKIWERPGEGLLRNDLVRFFSKQMRGLPWDTYDQSMNMLFGRPITDALGVILQPSSGLGGISSATNYRFPTDMLIDWVNSECFLHCFPVDMYRGDHSGYQPFVSAADDIPFSSLTTTSMGIPGLGSYTSISAKGDFRPSLTPGALSF